MVIIKALRFTLTLTKKCMRFVLRSFTLIKRGIKSINAAYHSACKTIVLRYKKLFKKYILADSAISSCHQILKNQSPDAAIQFLKNQYKLYKPRSVKFLIQFFNHLNSSSATCFANEGDNDLILHFCCWGDTYRNKAKDCLLPSLLSDDNLPNIVKRYKTTILVHCDTDTHKILSHSLLEKKIKKLAKLKLMVIPSSVLKSYNACLKYPKFLFFKQILAVNTNLRYTFLGCLQTQALEIALKNRCYISFLMPDFILSKDFLTQIFEQAKDKKVALATGFRTDYQKTFDDLKKFYNGEDKTQLSIPASDLARLKIRHIHADAKRRVVSPSTINFAPTAQLLFESKHGFVVRTFHLHPVLLNCKSYHHTVEMDYYPIDNTLLNQIINQETPYSDQLYICDNASKIAFMELTDSDACTPPLNITTKLNPQELIEAIKLMISSCPSVYGAQLNRYFSSARIKFESPAISKQGNFTSDNAFFSELEETPSDLKA